MPTIRTASATNLYRIVSFDRAAEIITGRRLYFAHPSTWDDPYEKILKHERARAIFAQCWCRKALSDAMWRIYSPAGLGVRIGTTRQRLNRTLTAAKANHNFNFRVQNVEYLSQGELDAELRRAKRDLAKEYTFENATEPLFLKRLAFDHEQEARVVVYDAQYLKGDPSKGLSIEVDPFELLRSIWIDPRAPDEVVKAYRYYLKEKLGFPGTVEKSGLYAVPDELAVQREA
jgi:hypothetical protein